MRANGVRSLSVDGLKCHHEAAGPSVHSGLPPPNEMQQVWQPRGFSHAGVGHASDRHPAPSLSPEQSVSRGVNAGV
jgi:hypothetical protein